MCPRMHHFHVYCQSRLVTFISKMDAFVEDPCEAPMLRKMMLLYSYCVDTEHVFDLTAPSVLFPKFVTFV